MKVPDLWKTSCIVPIPKKGRPSALNDYRPVALTSRVMKTFERLVLQHLRTLLTAFQDPLQFAYQRHIGVEDAIIFLTHKALSHLETKGSTVRVMFFDFSNAFNTIQPCLLRDKLLDMQLHPDISAWIFNYLTGRPHYVRVDGCVSDVVTGNTGEVVADYRKKKRPPVPVIIQGETVERVDSYKYLGVHINNKLDWSHSSDTLFRKGQSRIIPVQVPTI
nr:uncharacterized protein LOC114917641 [Labrus bergylta]